MTDITRISPKEARDHVTSGEALLVCAYDSDEKFRKYHLDGAISLTDFRLKTSGLAKDREIIFYCN